MASEVSQEDVKITKKDGSPFRFLVVDDSEFIRRSLKVVIKLLKCEVVGEAADGLEAIEIYKRERPDITTLDIIMPNMSGVDVVKEIIRLDPDAKIIMISSVGYQDMVKEAIVNGAKYFIVKPFKTMEAAITIKKVISKVCKDHI
jgi:two-component system, chemotaxis family, chemotaxis protein CheY